MPDQAAIPDQATADGGLARQLFDAKAATWPAKYAPGGRLTGRLAQFTDALAAHAPPGGRVLDLGCGTGDLARAASRAGLRVTACDISAGMLSRAAAGDPGNTVGWVQIDPVWRKLPFESGTFDAVVAASVLEYVERPRIALRECARVLRPGGIVLCTVPDPAHPVRWLEWAAGLAARLPLPGLARPGLARPGPLPTRLPLGRAAGGRWRRLRGYLTYLRISRHRRGAGWWRAVAAQSGLLTPASPASGAGHSPLRLLMFTRPASTGENS